MPPVSMRSREHPGHLRTVPADDVTAIATLVLAAGAAALAVVTCAVARDGRRRDDRKRAADRDRGDRQDSHPALCAQAHAPGPPVQPSRRAGQGNAAAARSAACRSACSSRLALWRTDRITRPRPPHCRAGSTSPRAGGAGQRTPGSRVPRGPRRRTREEARPAIPAIPGYRTRRQLSGRKCPPLPYPGVQLLISQNIGTSRVGPLGVRPSGRFRAVLIPWEIPRPRRRRFPSAAVRPGAIA